MKPEYDSKSTDDPELAKELTLQVRKVIGPFAAPKKIVSLVSFLVRDFNPLSSFLARAPSLPSPFLLLTGSSHTAYDQLDIANPQYIVTDLPKTRSGKIMRRVLRKIVSGEGDQLGDMSSLANPDSVEESKYPFSRSLKGANGIVKTKATPKK
jgi:acetyl-CoA synthetase